MTSGGLFGWLAAAPCGAFAVSLDQTILFWNRRAHEILGYSAGRVVGQKCYDVMAGAADSGLTPDCAGGCGCLRYARVGMVPASMDIMMRCASGARKLLSVRPMVLSASGDLGTVVVYLFGDVDEDASAPYTHWTVEPGDAGGLFTARELEVLRYLALGWDVPHIAGELGLSPHTVRNHSNNMRRKLDVSSSFEVVMVAVRLGLLTFNDGKPETGGS